MTRHTNIVSFDDVKNSSRTRYAQNQSSSRRSAGANNGYVYYDLNTFASPAPSRRQRSDERPERTQPRSQKQEAKRGKRSNILGAFSNLTQGPNASKNDQPRRTRSTRNLNSARDARSYDDEWAFDESWYAYEDEPPAEYEEERPKRSKRQEQRAKRTKERANKMFLKQYADDGATPDTQEGAPRAALYETSMGSSHRKAARMQKASEAGSYTAKINPAGWFSNLSISPRKLKLGTAVLCLVLTAVFLYTPAQHYYQSVREHDRLEAEYAYVEERNAALIAQNESLASNAGMEDAVRQKYGYVVSGDETAVVTGLSDGTVDSHRSPNGVEANVLSSSVKAPEEWYTPYLDAFFGVS